MHLPRCMFFFEAHFSCRLYAVHIPGVLNDRVIGVANPGLDLAGLDTAVHD